MNTWMDQLEASNAAALAAGRAAWDQAYAWHCGGGLEPQEAFERAVADMNVLRAELDEELQEFKASHAQRVAEILTTLSPDSAEGCIPPVESRAAQGAQAMRSALAGAGLDIRAARQAEMTLEGSLTLRGEVAEAVFGIHSLDIVRVVRTRNNVRIVGNLPAPPDGFYHPYRLDCDLGDDGVWSYVAVSVADGHDEDGCASAAGRTAAEALGAVAGRMSMSGMGGDDTKQLLGTPHGDWLGCPKAPPRQPTGQEYRERCAAIERAARRHWVLHPLRQSACSPLAAD